MDDEYVAPMELNARIFKARSDAKMTQEDLANAVHKTRSAVAQWEKGEIRPRHATLVAIANVTKADFYWLLNGGEIGTDKVGLRVVGEVAAGLWREGNADFTGKNLNTPTQPVAAHPDYPPHAQRLYKVIGTSINRVADDGEYLHAVDIFAGDIKPEQGDLVIVRRLEHGKAEYTAKTLAFAEGEWVLRPESFDPEWQQDIKVEGNEDVEVTITDVVIAKWSPIARRRPLAKPFVDPFHKV
ncbi:helix-turn-helix domain-containing protein [Mesorhizobium sp. M0088]|uniref:helix-turn-helix domain-containing protein n=1 Tax=Mesorhizobium sp. M0088 TaxID=2956873 RepID=UPI0033378E5A